MDGVLQALKAVRAAEAVEDGPYGDLSAVLPDPTALTVAQLQVRKSHLPSPNADLTENPVQICVGVSTAGCITT